MLLLPCHCEGETSSWMGSPGPISKSSFIAFQDPTPQRSLGLQLSASSLSPGPLPHKVSLMREGAHSLGSGLGTRLISPQALPWDSYSPPPIAQSPWLSNLCSGPEPFPLCVQPIAEQFLLGLLQASHPTYPKLNSLSSQQTSSSSFSCPVLGKSHQVGNFMTFFPPHLHA